MSCVWWSYYCFGMRIQPCHFFCRWAQWQPATLNNTLHACFRFSSILCDRQAKASSSARRNGSFRIKTDNRNKTRWTKTFPYFNHHESWAAVPTSVIAISLTLRWRLESTSRETDRMHHNHCHYHHTHTLVLILSNVKLCVKVLRTVSYLSITISMTLTLFQGHGNVKYF